MNLKVLRKRLMGNPDSETLEQLIKTYIMHWDMKSLKIILRDYAHMLEDRQRINIEAVYYLGTLQIRKLKSIFPKLHPTTKSSILFYLGYPLKAKSILENYYKNREIPPVHKYALATIKLYIGEILDIEKTHKNSVFSQLAYLYLQSLRHAFAGNVKKSVSILEENIKLASKYGFINHALFSLSQMGLFSNNVGILDAVKHAAESLGNRYLFLRSEVYKRFLNRERLKVPKILRFFSYIMNFESDIDFPEDLKGLKHILWYVQKVRDNETYLSFSNKLRLMKGLEEVKMPKHLLITLAYIKSVGKDKLYDDADLVFPSSSNPKRRAWENISRLKDLMDIETDLALSVKSGMFLKEEDELWAWSLKRYMGMV